jgi:hypothetical protein
LELDDHVRFDAWTVNSNSPGAAYHRCSPDVTPTRVEDVLGSEKGGLSRYHSPSVNAFCPPGATAGRSRPCCAGPCVDLWFGRYSLDHARR